MEYNSIETIDNTDNYLIKDAFSNCSCGRKDCTLAFLQKRTIIKLFEDFIKKYEHLPIDIEFISVKKRMLNVESPIDYMTIQVTITQTGVITVKDIENKK